MTLETVVHDLTSIPYIKGNNMQLSDKVAIALWLAAVPSTALSGQSIVVSHGWHMQ